MYKYCIQLCARFGGVHSGTVPTIDVETWLQQFDQVHRQCGCDKALCGLKVNHLAWLTVEQFLRIGPKLVIRTWRNEEDTARSYITNARRGMKQYNLERLEKETKGSIEFVRINIPAKNEPRLPRETAIEKLEPYMERLRKLKCSIQT
jgi:hypothetical protein